MCLVSEDKEDLDTLVNIIQIIDTKRVDLCRLSAYINMARLGKLPNFESLGLNRNVFEASKRQLPALRNTSKISLIIQARLQ